MLQLQYVLERNHSIRSEPVRARPRSGGCFALTTSAGGSGIRTLSTGVVAMASAALEVLRLD